MIDTRTVSTDGDANVIEAPGEVALAVHPAGIGSRFIAALLDHLVLAGVFVMLVVLQAFELGAPQILGTAALLLYAAWFVVPEAIAGRTLGKAAVDLRVIRDDGQALDLRGALVRNLVRIAYVLPPVYVLEILLVALDPRSRRLGDILAGTVVIGERRVMSPVDLFLRVPPRERPKHPVEALERARPTDDEYQALRTFCFRTRTLPIRERRVLAQRLLAPLYARAGLELPEPWDVEELLVDLMHHVNGTFAPQAK